MTIVINSDDAVQIRDDIYCKNPTALNQALSDLREIGYTNVIRQDPIADGEVESNGWPRWIARLDIARKGKCNSCQSLIDPTDIRSHNHMCEVCGAVTFLKFVEGTTVCFFFGLDKLVGFGPKLSMRVIRWDYQEGWLYLEPEILKSSERRVVHGEQGRQYLDEHSNYWELVELDGAKAIKVRFTNDENHDFRRDIGICDFEKQFVNYKLVNIWNGTEYNEYARLPLRQSIILHEAWRWAPLEQTPTLYEKIIEAAYLVSRANYYTPGQLLWDPGHYQFMGIFIRHFTTLDADEWDRLSPNFPLDGPGGIAAVKAFCDSEPNRQR